MHVEFIDAIDTIEPAAWNALSGAQHPFLRHEFLEAIETAACVGPGTGWKPSHVVIRDDGAVVAALPLYEKTDSWGEFVFDFAWANAYAQAGLSYYPKLVSAIPFTPAAGPRFLTSADDDFATLAGALADAVQRRATERGWSSWHTLFPDDRDAGFLADRGLLLRKDCQFHWQNRGYATFDDFLGRLRAAKRKKVRRERRRIRESGVTFRWLGGAEMTPDVWREIMPLYASTFLYRGRAPYLNQAFFERVAASLPEHLLVIVASHNDEAIASAICFRSTDTLYGRYWGSAGQYHSLHFETCYYQGIDYCIANGIARFEPGTQGEHKISRGFEPTETWSAHWLSHPRFAEAIDAYLDRERAYTDSYIDAVRDHVPFRRDSQ